MTNSAPAPGSAIATFRARLVKLAADPRARWLPEAQAVARELIAFLDELEVELEVSAGLAGRVAALERSISSVIQLEAPNCDD